MNMNNMRSKMLERRENLRKSKQSVATNNFSSSQSSLGNDNDSAAHHSSETDNVNPPDKSEVSWPSSGTEKFAKCEAYPSLQNSSETDQSVSENIDLGGSVNLEPNEPFLPVQKNAAGPIPGLGDGEDSEKKVELSKEDLKKISQCVKGLSRPSEPSSSSEPPRKVLKGQDEWSCSRCQMRNFSYQWECKFCRMLKEDHTHGRQRGLGRYEGFRHRHSGPRLHQNPGWYPPINDASELFESRNARYNPNPAPPLIQQSWESEESLFSRRDDVDSGHFPEPHPPRPPKLNLSQNVSDFCPPEVEFSAKVVDYGHGGGQQPCSNRPRSPKGDRIAIDDLVQAPGRYVRPPKMVIIFRGLPGAGKTYIAKHLKDLEAGLGSEPPRILALDDYFECDGEYEYDCQLEDTFRESLIKSFKKQVDDGYFSFIMVDSINEKTCHYKEMWSYAKQKGFEVYVGEVKCDVSVCTQRNIHQRSERDICDLSRNWEPTPSYFNTVDFSSLLQDKAIAQVEMEDADQSDANAKETEADPSHQLSKWEVMDKEDKLAQLDGVSQKAIKRLAEHHSSINEWLEIPTDDDDEEPNKKKVRWADIEERKKQMKMRDIGFVVGQNWNRIMDPTEGSSALTKTKIIPNRFQ